jgi:hypothetical protein
MKILAQALAPTLTPTHGHVDFWIGCAMFIPVSLHLPWERADKAVVNAARMLGFHCTQDDRSLQHPL